MEEQILIKGNLDKKTKKKFLILILSFLGVALFFVFLGIIVGITCDRNFLVKYDSKLISGRYLCEYRYKCNEVFATKQAFIWHCRVDHNSSVDIFGFGMEFFIINWAFILFAGIVALIYAIHRKCQLTITDKNVKGKTLFGKEVVLPIHMISAYSTRKFLSTVAITTSSGITKFSFIENYKEIGEILQNLLNERQLSTQTTTVQQTITAPQTANNNFDDLAKLKSLLDSGVITQEEFDVKKKQILGL